MRSTRPVLAARILCSVTAAVALTAGCAGLAAASELPATSTPYTPADEVPWTGFTPEVPWTAPAPQGEVPWTGQLSGPVGGVVEVVADLAGGGDGEVPWT